MALDYLPSPGWAVIYGETPSATRWSELGDNDDALATGAGWDDAIIKTRHLGSGTDLNIPPSNLNLGAQSAIVTNNESTSSTSFTNLTTLGPQVTVTVGDAGVVLVLFRAQVASGAGNMGIEMSGANTQAVQQEDAAFQQSIGNQTKAGFKLYTGLNPGSTNFTAKYKADTGTAQFLRRYIAVIPLG